MHEIATQGFAYPNELHVAWSVMIALYPYITGLVAGAFIVSSLYHVFGDKDLKPVGNMALVAALCFIMFCMTPLLFHLGQPFRCFNIMFTPNLMSAMSIFGYICFFYMGILLVEIWLVFREDIVKRSKEGFIVKRWFYALLALGVTEMTDESRALDKKIVGVLAAVGIPSACILHGYVGFIFGAVKSNPWWSTPLMPLIFLLSAIVSGIAVLILMYMIAMKLTGRAVSVACIAQITVTAISSSPVRAMQRGSAGASDMKSVLVQSRRSRPEPSNSSPSATAESGATILPVGSCGTPPSTATVGPAPSVLFMLARWAHTLGLCIAAEREAGSKSGSSWHPLSSTRPPASESACSTRGSIRSAISSNLTVPGWKPTRVCSIW